MATNVVAAGKQEPDEEPSSPPPARGGGPDRAGSAGEGTFFAIYKKGQGYWTRMLTAGGALLILLLTAQFLYGHALATLDNRDLRIGISAGFLVVAGGLIWWLINKPSSSDFLIATDSEMKKVNWTSREELIGSTRVVIIFVLLIALILFGVDLFFGYFFYWIDVLKTKPI